MPVSTLLKQYDQFYENIFMYSFVILKNNFAIRGNAK